MTSLNRPSDALNQERNSFGFQSPNNYFKLGTKGDVHTFFLVINDLISKNFITDSYSTISFDLYRTFVGDQNLERFKNEWPELQNVLGKISPTKLDWSVYPYNTKLGKFDYEKEIFDLTQSSVAGVFSKYFKSISDACEWMDIALKRDTNKYIPRIITAPTEIISGTKYMKYPNQAFLDSAEDPLWLREPGE